MKVIDGNDEIPWVGEAVGELLLRWPWSADEYYYHTRSERAFIDGCFHTGDVITVNEEGVIQLVDRTSDLIKSGGEWISSVDLENALMTHESVFEATVVAIPDPEWDERPIACVVLNEGFNETDMKEKLLSFLKPQFAKFWIPDDVLFYEEIPKTSVGKFLKRELRTQLEEHYQSKQDL